MGILKLKNLLVVFGLLLTLQSYSYASKYINGYLEVEDDATVGGSLSVSNDLTVNGTVFYGALDPAIPTPNLQAVCNQGATTTTDITCDDIRPNNNAYLRDNKRLYLGNGNDAYIYHDSSSGILNIENAYPSGDIDFYVNSGGTQTEQMSIDTAGVKVNMDFTAARLFMVDDAADNVTINGKCRKALLCLSQEELDADMYQTLNLGYYYSNPGYYGTLAMLRTGGDISSPRIIEEPHNLFNIDWDIADKERNVTVIRFEGTTLEPDDEDGPPSALQLWVNDGRGLKRSWYASSEAFDVQSPFVLSGIGGGSENILLSYESGGFVGYRSFDSRITGTSLVDMSGGVNNRLVTASDSNSLVGEGNATFDGSTLGITGDIVATGSILGGNTRINGDGIDLRLSANSDMYIQNYGVEKGFIFTSSDGISGQDTLLKLEGDTKRLGVLTENPAGTLDVQDGTGTQTAGDFVVDGDNHVVYVGQLDATTGNTTFAFRDRLGNEKIKWFNASFGSHFWGNFGEDYGIQIGHSPVTSKTSTDKTRGRLEVIGDDRDYALYVEGDSYFDGDVSMTSNLTVDGYIYGDCTYVTGIETGQWEYIDADTLGTLTETDNIYIGGNLSVDGHLSTGGNVDGQSSIYRGLHINTSGSDLAIADTQMQTVSEPRAFYLDASEDSLELNVDTTIDGDLSVSGDIYGMPKRIGFCSRNSTTAISASTWTVATFSNEDEDTESAFDGSAFTVPETGLYDISAVFTFASVTDGNRYIVAVSVNSTSAVTGMIGRGIAGGTNVCGAGGNIKMFLDEGDVLRCIVWCENATSGISSTGYQSFSAYKM